MHLQILPVLVDDAKGMEAHIPKLLLRGGSCSIVSPAHSCGLPKEEAYHFIIENEGYDRSYYSGFIGWLDPKGKTDLYVNLRCMNILPQTFTLYAGGGLLAASQLEDEWQETEDKLDTMRRIVGNL